MIFLDAIIYPIEMLFRFLFRIMGFVFITAPIAASLFLTLWAWDLMKEGASNIWNSFHKKDSTPKDVKPLD